MASVDQKRRPTHLTDSPRAAYIPGGQTIDRYLWVVQWLVANGWWVL